MDDEGSLSYQEDRKSVPSTDASPFKAKDYVAATLSAWNACPSIVKKQLDRQSDEIGELSSKLREAELKLGLRKNEFERIVGAKMKVDLMKHKENIEKIYNRRLEEEKRKLLKQRVDEVD